jgi:hypothetical protein
MHTLYTVQLYYNYSNKITCNNIIKNLQQFILLKSRATYLNLLKYN